MSIVNQVKTVASFAKVRSKQAEKELIAELKDPGSAQRLEHASQVVLGRIHSLVTETERSFEQRKTEAQVVAAGFISGVSVLLLGPPGTAKSALIRRLASLCGLASGQEPATGLEAPGHRNDSHPHGGYFEYLLTNHTMPEELFGGPDLKALAEGRFARVVEGKLPCAEIAFLDEVFRGGSHILNTLLTIINEKRYDSGNGAVHVPLLGLVGASNHAKLDQELEAFFDRFPVRVWVRSVLEPDVGYQRRPTDSGVAARLAQRSVNAEIARLSEAWDPEQADQNREHTRVCCTNDFRFARIFLLRKLAMLEGNPGNLARFKQFEAMFRAVRERVQLSDRALGQLWLFAGALDLVLGKDPLRPYPESEGHLRIVKHIARTPEELAYLHERYDQQTRGTQHGRNV
jgi:MoxR-like ATPase